MIKTCIMVMFIFLFNSYGIEPREKSIIGSVEFTVQGADNDVIDEENWFVTDGGFYIIFRDSSGNVIDSTNLKYSHTVFAGNVSVSYHFLDDVSVGLEYEYSNLNQSAETTHKIKNNSASLLTLHKFGPIASFSFSLSKKVCFSPTVWLPFGFGNLTRIPVIYSTLSTKPSWMEQFHQPISVAGFGFGFHFPFYFYTKNSLCFKVAAKYDYFHFGIDDYVYNYIDKSNCHNYGISFGLGFATNLEY